MFLHRATAALTAGENLLLGAFFLRLAGAIVPEYVPWESIDAALNEVLYFLIFLSIGDLQSFWSDGSGSHSQGKILKRDTFSNPRRPKLESPTACDAEVDPTVVPRKARFLRSLSLFAPILRRKLLDPTLSLSIHDRHPNKCAKTFGSNSHRLFANGNRVLARINTGRTRRTLVAKN
ncbi:MAG TPA: hypothetical protein VGW39_01385 [Chthoniobacterales bacterium]|nr:hypothetical protein [Chthoniobacterales bacterium]